MRNLTLAVDPGVTGAAAIVDDSGRFVGLADLPIVRDGKLAWVDADFGYWIRDVERVADPPGAIVRAVVERVSAQAGFGTANAFRFGMVLGSILAILRSRSLAVEFVAAAEWKTALKLGTDKRVAIARAHRLFPAVELDLALHHNRAEALLLAHYAVRESRTKSAA